MEPVTYKETHTIEPTVWNSVVSHPLQSWEWGEFRKKTNITVVRIGAYSKNEKLVAGYQITFHKLPHLPFSIGYFPKGPLPTEGMVEILKKIGEDHRAIFIQLEPNTPISSLKKIPSSLVRSHHPLFTQFTFVLDLTKSEDELMKEMHSKTRYNIKVAQKHNVVITEDTKGNLFHEYIRLTRETTQRQGFYAHSENYHKNMWQTLSQGGMAKLFTASYNNEVIATWIIFAFGDTLYYPYGASSRTNREVMAPTLLLWEIVLWGKKNGYKKFDLWGAMGPNPDIHDPFYGFHRFKEGFHPELVEFIGSYDLIIHSLLYRMYCVADTIRWKILKAKKK